MEICSLPRKDFDKLLLEAVDEGLSSLGESPKQAIYFYLKERFNVKKQRIPHEIEAFVDGIEKIFGLGASFLENLILKRLYEKVELSFRWQVPKDLTFVECVALANRSFVWKKRSEKTVEELVQCEELMLEG